MNEIPMWWLILSGIFFFLVAVLFVALCFMVWSLIKLVQGLQPQVSGLMTKVNDDLIPNVNSVVGKVNNDLMPQVQGLVNKVESLTAKVDGIADSARGITDSAKGTVDNVGDRVRGITDGIEHIALSATNKFEKAAPIIGIAVAGLRLYTMFMEMRGQKPGRVKIEKTKGSVAVELQPEAGNPRTEEGSILTS